MISGVYRKSKALDLSKNFFARQRLLEIKEVQLSSDVPNRCIGDSDVLVLGVYHLAATSWKENHQELEIQFLQGGR